MGMEGVQPSVKTIQVDRGFTKQSEDVTLDINRAVEMNREQQEQQKEEPTDIPSIQKAIKLINKTMESYNTEVRFTLHEESGEYMVKVVNTNDNSVVREIPPKRVLDMVAHFKEMLGLVVDKFI